MQIVHIILYEAIYMDMPIKNYTKAKLYFRFQRSVFTENFAEVSKKHKKSKSKSLIYFYETFF